MRAKNAFQETWRIIKRDIENLSTPHDSWNRPEWHSDGKYGGNQTLTKAQKDIKRERKEAFIIVGMENFQKTFMKNKKSTLEKEVSRDDLVDFQKFCDDLKEKHPITTEMRQYVIKHPYYHRRGRLSQDSEKPVVNQNHGSTNDDKRDATINAYTRDAMGRIIVQDGSIRR